ncbi:ATP-binding protein [Candidatus Entotheonella palauensis]|uniref:ATP-binding protein n=1 Tax=Candidatus Entotheonella palauensis TaxID=93172 RepID=UPI000B7CDF70|nr:AAA family ATPase [Candidatus Entotheonella palauensis]
MTKRIHILGASGSGTTTLGLALIERLNYPHFDTDDYFWLPTDLPFTQKRDAPLRQKRLMGDLTAHDAWVLSGSLCGWGDVAIPLFELVVYLRIPPAIRLERLRQREMARYGERIMPGGDMYEKSQAFLKWAASYDEGGLDMRSRCLHEQWLSSLPCPVVRIEGEHAIEEEFDILMREISFS